MRERRRRFSFVGAIDCQSVKANIRLLPEHSAGEMRCDGKRKRLCSRRAVSVRCGAKPSESVSIVCMNSVGDGRRKSSRADG